MPYADAKYPPESCPYVTGTVTKYCTLNLSENPNSSTLTDEERASMTRAIETLEGVEYIDAFSTENDANAAATLRGLLERLK